MIRDKSVDLVAKISESQLKKRAIHNNTISILDLDPGLLLIDFLVNKNAHKQGISKGRHRNRL